MDRAKYYLVREGAFASFLADSFTFGCIGFLLYANEQWLGGHAIVALTLVIMGIISTTGKSKLKRFDTEEELIENLKSNQ